MKKIQLLLLSALLCAGINIQAQTKTPAAKPVAKPAAKTAVAKTPAAPVTKIYTILIKGGHVIDPKNNIDAIMDVAIASPPAPAGAPAGGQRGGGGGRGGAPGKIALIAKNIDPALARQVIDAKGLYVTPGLIDIHTHNFWGTNLNFQYADGPNGLPPDGFTFRNGVTTIVDAGSPGWKNFPKYRLQTIQRSQTRVLVWLNIVGGGMRGEGRYESDTTDMNTDSTAKVVMDNKDAIVGIKVAHYTRHDWIPIDRAEAAAKIANVPIMVDFGGTYNSPALSLETLLMEKFRPGDVFTHCFGQLWPARDFIIDTLTGKPKPYVLAARKKGVFFDVGYGGISFSYSQAIPAIKAGFLPNSISTDLHTGSMNAAMKDMLTCMDKIMAIGVPLKEVIAESTWNPAKEIKREELGNLSVGADADIAILGMRTGSFGLFDYKGTKVVSPKKLECEMTIRAGRIVYDLNGRAVTQILAVK